MFRCEVLGVVGVNVLGWVEMWGYWIEFVVVTDVPPRYNCVEIFERVVVKL